MFSLRTLLDATIEVGHTHNGLYRLADTSLVFLDSHALENVKSVIKGFQIFPDLLSVLKEWHKTGKIEKPFTATVVFLRDLAVELEVASDFGLIAGSSSEEDRINRRLITTIASIMHIVVMGFVGYHGVLSLRAGSRLSPAAYHSPMAIHKRIQARLAVATATTKIAQQSFQLLDTNYHNLARVLTLIFNICAIVSCVFNTRVMRKLHKKQN